jgi:glyoxylase-like metal-dependent hydrolase (beta-lactamase superfamily II)
MRVELLPSCVPAGPHQFLVSFVVDEQVVIDAGSVGLLADLGRQRAVRHVFVTHEHLDHIASLPILLENTYEPGPSCIEVLATPEVLEFLHRDIFNGRVWPDFYSLSRGSDRFLRLTPLVPGEAVERAGLRITPLPVSHAVSTVGLLVEREGVAVAFPSDTGPTTGFWRRLDRVEGLRAVFLEASFPSSMRELADACGHLCPESFAEEIRKLALPVRWIVVHRKARYAGEIAAEFERLCLPDVEMVEPGRVYDF